jgi:hypothetical protein
VRREWEPEELIGAWTLVDRDRELVGNKSGPTRLGFAVMLRFYEIEGLFPAYREEVPAAAVDYGAALVKVSPAAFAKYSWASRMIKRHRAQIRTEFGTRPAGEADEERWAVWLSAEVCRWRRPGGGWRRCASSAAPSGSSRPPRGRLSGWRPRRCGGSRTPSPRGWSPGSARRRAPGWRSCWARKPPAPLPLGHCAAIGYGR